VKGLRGLAQPQQLLQSIHGVQAAPVGDFLVGRAFRDRHAPLSSPHEALLLRENGEELHVALFLDETVLQQLGRPAHRPWTHERLQAFCAATEGVSHFLYVAHRAGQGGQVSQLELEAQGEIDKYLAVLMQLWATGRRGASRELRRRLFEQSVLRPGLSAPERDRYRLASALAAACARAWEARYVRPGRLDALLREARRLYRLAGGEKFSALAQGDVAWAA